jgi:4-hydroxybenzoate polyprenyltransferase
MRHRLRSSTPLTPAQTYAWVIALGAWAQVCLTYQLWAIPFHGELALLVGIGTFLIYRWHTALIRGVWAWVLLVLGWMLMAYWVITALIPLRVALAFGLLGFAVIAYYRPWSRFRRHWISLRNRPGWKIWVIAGVWSLSVIGIPALQAIDQVQVFWLQRLLEHFVFIVFITLPFDIRDYQQDQMAGLRTLPHWVGKENAWQLCKGIGFFHLLLVMLFYNNALDRLMAYAIIDVMLLWAMAQRSWRNSTLFYYVLLDGSLFVQALFVGGTGFWRI